MTDPVEDTCSPEFLQALRREHAKAWRIIEQYISDHDPLEIQHRAAVQAIQDVDHDALVRELQRLLDPEWKPPEWRPRKHPDPSKP